MKEFSWESQYRDKFGRIIECDELEILMRNQEYRIVKAEMIGKHYISTVWLPIAHGVEQNENFETVVFRPPAGTKDPRKNLGLVLDCARYYDMTEAEEGHKLMVDIWTEKQES